MNAIILEPRKWSGQRWWTLIALVFAAHIGLIFALGDRKPFAPRPPAFAPSLRLTVDYDELLALNDPTLFALPHREGFAGATWLRIPDLKYEPFHWTEPPRLLALPVEKLGGAFAQFMRTNRLAPFELELKPVPQLTMPVAPAPGLAVAARSTLRIGGGLAGRHLRNPPELPPQPWTDLLTNSVAQVLVNPDGNVISATLLGDSGSREADQLALKTAKSARFEPLRNGDAQLTIGTLIFQWYTVPATNALSPAQ